MAKKFPINKLHLLIAVPISILLFGSFFLSRSSSFSFPTFFKPPNEDFQAPGRDWPSPKTVEDYFIEHERMTPAEALRVRSDPDSDGTITLRLMGNSIRLEALLSNLQYYGFVRQPEALRYALEHTTDVVPGKANALKIGQNTINIDASYRISEDMTAWEVADQLLNHPTYLEYDQYGYLFMP